MFVIVVASSFDGIGSVNVELSVDKTSVAVCIECLDEEETVVFGNVIIIEVAVDLGVISVFTEDIASIDVLFVDSDSDVKAEIVPVLLVDVIVVFVIVVASSFDVIGRNDVKISVDNISVAV